MDKRLMTGVVAGGLLLAMPPGVAAGATPEEVATAKCLKAAAMLGYEASDFDEVFVGTNGDDTTYLPGDVDHFYNYQDDLICAFGGRDFTYRVAEHDVFIGGNGDDEIGFLYDDSAFYGGNGDDSVGGPQAGALHDSKFDGGNGDDFVWALRSDAAFIGGNGDDSVNINEGTFDGGKGGDCVADQTAGTFDGGNGFDWATIVVGGSTSGVEDTTSALACPTP